MGVELSELGHEEDVIIIGMFHTLFIRRRQDICIEIAQFDDFGIVVANVFLFTMEV